MVAYQEELYASARSDALIQMHYDEIAQNKDAVPLNPDWDRYEALENAGDLVCIAARDEGRLIGYSVFFLIWHIHYNTTRMAMNDVLYLHPEYRKGFTGIRLIKSAEQILKDRGAELVKYHVKTDHDFSAILHRMGYANEEIIIGKLL